MIARLTGVLFAALVLFLVVLVGVLSSTAGNRLIVRFVEEQLAPALEISGLSGSLLGDLCADGVRFETDGFSVVLSDVCVNPALWLSLDFLRIQLRSVRAGTVIIETRETDQPASEPGEIRLPVPIIVDRLEVGRLEVDGFPLTAIDAAAAISNSSYAVEGRFAYDDIVVALQTGGPLAAFRVDARALDVELHGQVDLLAEGLPYTLELAAVELDLAGFIERPVLLQDLHLNADGDLSGYRYDVRGSVVDPTVQSRIEAEGSGDWQSIRFSAFELTGVQLSAQPDIQVHAAAGSGEIRWLETFSAVFEGVTARGVAAGQLLDASVAQLTLTDAEVAIESGSALLEAGGRLDVDGRFGFDGALEGRLEGNGLPLSLAREDLDGTLSVRVNFSGTADGPFVEGEAAVSGMAIADQALGDLQLTMSGNADGGNVQLVLDAGQGTLDTALRYVIQGDRVALTVTEAVAAYPALEATARLENPSTVLIDAGQVRADDVCLLLQSGQIDAAPGRLCGNLDYPDGGLELVLDAWTMPELPLPGSGASMNGQVAVQVDVETFDPVQGTARLSFADLVANHPDLDPLRLGSLEMNVDLADDRARALLTTPGDGSQELTLTGNLTSELAPMLENSTLAGRLQLELNGIWLAESLLPMDVAFELARIRGAVSVTADVAGTIGEPLINGRLNLKDAGWDVLAVNAQVSDLNLEATLTDTTSIAFESAGAVSPGRLALRGSIDGLGTESPRLLTDVTLDGAGLVNLPDYEAEVDGNLSLSMGAEDLRVRGEVSLPRANILIADLPETAVTASRDEIIVDEEASQSNQQVRTTDVTLSLGDEVFLQAFGLRSRLSGSLRLRETPGRLQSVTGSINLREAEFEAYGQVFRVERGQLTFAGPIDNPAVDVVATRIVSHQDRDFRISLVISGTAQNLETQIMSQPPLPEEDALALLITGRTFSQITSSEQRSSVSGTALSMGILSATGITQDLATSLNLEEIIVDQDTEGNMEVGAAVRLRRNLYLRYTYGVFSRLGGVLLRYRINSRLSVQATTGDSHSIELRYGVDD